MTCDKFRRWRESFIPIGGWESYLGVSLQTIKKYENGKSPIPKVVQSLYAQYEENKFLRLLSRDYDKECLYSQKLKKQNKELKNAVSHWEDDNWILRQRLKENGLPNT